MVTLDCGAGWFEIVETLCSLLSDMNSRQADSNIWLLGVEEKFGMLRISLSGRNPEAREWIRFAEMHSTRTCEICGKIGRLMYQDGWQRTRCEAHSLLVRWSLDD